MTRERSGRVGAGHSRRRTARGRTWARWRHARAAAAAETNEGSRHNGQNQTPGFAPAIHAMAGLLARLHPFLPCLPMQLHSGVRTKSSGIQQRGLRRHVREHVSCHRLPVSPSSRHAGGHRRVSGAFYISCAAMAGAGRGVFKYGYMKNRKSRANKVISNIHQLNI